MQVWSWDRAERTSSCASILLQYIPGQHWYKTTTTPPPSSRAKRSKLTLIHFNLNSSASQIVGIDRVIISKLEYAARPVLPTIPRWARLPRNVILLTVSISPVSAPEYKTPLEYSYISPRSTDREMFFLSCRLYYYICQIQYSNVDILSSRTWFYRAFRVYFYPDHFILTRDVFICNPRVLEQGGTISLRSRVGFHSLLLTITRPTSSERLALIVHRILMMFPISRCIRKTSIFPYATLHRFTSEKNTHPVLPPRNKRLAELI